MAIFALLLTIGAFGWLVFAILFRDTAGQDWMVFDAAARAYWRGDKALLLDGVRLTQVLNATYTTLRQPIVFHPWVYPPYTLLLALPFGLLPWWLSYGGFQILSFAAMTASLRSWESRAQGFWLVLGGVTLCPATAYTIGAGQNSFLSAALVLGGVRLLDRRPLSAGILLGLLAFKPQLGLLIPVVLIAARRWRAVAGASATVAALVAVSLVVPGLSIWRGWLHLFLGGQSDLAPRQWVELYGQSVFTCLRLAGLSAWAANLGQGIALLIGAAAVWHAFRTQMEARRRMMVLLCAIAFSSPHFGDYDAVLLGIAAMLMLVPPGGGAAGFGSGATPLALLAWASTAINPPLLFLKTIPFLFPFAELTPVVVLALLFRLVFPSADRHDMTQAAWS